MIAAIILSWAFDFGRYVDLVGSIPGGLPVIALPDASWSLDLVITLMPTAFAMFIVILTQSAATSRSYASKYNEVFSEDRDLSGLAMANFGAALSGTFVVNGSPTKTQMVDGAGGRTQLSQLVTVVIVLVVLLFLTGALAYLPESVLYAVVFVIGLQLIDLKGMRKIYTERRSEFWVALSTAIMVIVIGVEEGIIFAIFLSLIEHTRHGYHPKNTLVTKAGREAFKTMPVSSHAQILPGLVVYRFVHSLYYANSALFSEEVSDLVNNATNPVKWFCLDASAIDDIDFTASETLYSTCELLKEKGVRVVFSQLNKDLKEAHKKPLEQIIDEDIFYHTNFDVVKAYEQKYGTEPQKSA